ncbi:MAG: hypothetical protein A4S12_08310 [Proteobacteria bacterium SG_bin5]|nr:DUF3459 domain-containing protein [Sphingomonas sp.]OQW41571.1 MAG: hypothetical protein A4S12_08310 [Proteobacteria bacterium SG_bin5]
MRKSIGLLAAALLAILPGSGPARTAPERPELFYHIFVRSFADSDGDRQGDLNGIRARLDYLQSLGVTTVLLTPLYPSSFYHNYFADDFEGIDPEFGTMRDFSALVADLHARGMKIILDQEIQYVTGAHAWYRQSHQKPGGAFDGFLLYKDASNREAVPTLTASNDYLVWPNQRQQIFTVNLAEPKVCAYFTRYLKNWLDPNQDGDPRDGVDGFRIDHMMDDLDNRGALTNLFGDFWVPMLAELRALNPKVQVIAEQADWGDGEAFFTRGKVDRVFAFPIWRAAHDLDAAAFAAAINRSNDLMTAGRDQLVFIENHDTDRFASGPGTTPAIRRLGAAITLLTGWTPSLYYGQEIGMAGTKLENPGANADVADIPRRQAFRWVAGAGAAGNAGWYCAARDAYDAPDCRSSGDALSVVGQERDRASLLNAYRQLSALRARTPALARGATRVVAQSADLVLIERATRDDRALILFNFGKTAQAMTLAAPAALTRRFGDATLRRDAQGTSLSAPPYSATVWTRSP